MWKRPKKKRTQSTDSSLGEEKRKGNEQTGLPTIFTRTAGMSLCMQKMGNIRRDKEQKRGREKKEGGNK